MDRENNFEAKFQRLEEIVKKIETKALPLDESISLYDEGTKIIAELDRALSSAEAKINEISHRASRTEE